MKVLIFCSVDRTLLIIPIMFRQIDLNSLNITLPKAVDKN